MSILLNIVLIVLGVALVIWGANIFTDGASRIATLLRVPQIVIGLTIVAFGTSLPELCISLFSAIMGSPGMAVGNVVGSNIFNAMLIVGMSAAIMPITILRSTVRKDIPFALAASVALLLMCLDNDISRLDAILLLCGFAGFMWYTLSIAKGKETESDEKEKTADSSQNLGSFWKNALYIVVGIGALILGSQIFVRSASEVAAQLHVSDAVIGLTIVAGGTSLPELATSIVSARKGQSAIAIGNVIGSNVFNILLILGVTGVISPMSVYGITTLDFSMLVGSMLILWAASYTELKIERWEGIGMSVIFLAYISWLVYGAIA